ncbi:MAG: extracellular solute-binding protein [Sphaerochaeta sp.]|uniref:extracellular solute-binding protein n=1 Tax=Sphaerochaeta sp. TaxID=1972642 RepID=UPI000AC40E36|nr:extracellular solute-binding protein [Sphaerochaeta sp.]MCK9598565.1 extracellular solute-binding protein [Sphaerochaeta sp.]MDX9825399.1 extracellular solute-binding protein [Sphaerochaeta sp.]
MTRGMQQMTRSLLALVLVVLISTTLFAAGVSESGAGPTKITLTIAGRDGAYGDSLQLAADEYQKLHPEVSFEILKLSGASLFEKTVIDLRSKTGTYDLILIDDPNAPQYQEVGWLADLGAMYTKKGLSVDADFIKPALDLGRYPYNEKGKLYALPFAGNVELFAYRTDLFAKYGFGEPATWTELLEAVKVIDAKEPGVDGVVFRGTKGNPIVTAFMPIFWAFGGKVLDESGRVTINSEAGLKSLKYFLEMSKYAPEGTVMYQSAQVRDALYAGTAAVAPEVWPGWIGDLENPSVSHVVGKVKVTKHPGEVVKSSPMIGAWLIAIPESSKQKDAAFDFLLHLTGSEMQLAMSDAYGLPPSRSSVYEVESQRQKYPWYDAQHDALLNSVARPRSVKWKEIEDILGGVLQVALMGNISAESALASVEKSINEVLK